MTVNISARSRPQSVALVPTSAKRQRVPSVTFLSACVALALATTVLPVQQAAAQQQQAQQSGLEEITVTGSRIHQNQDYASPNPISTFDAQKMENLGLINISDVITQVPQNVSQFQAATTGGSAFFIGSTLANLRGLNPFFGTRTLTLVNSRRFIPTTQGDSVDLNFIPSILINRTEVVTGGASAAYDSGAISGGAGGYAALRYHAIEVVAVLKPEQGKTIRVALTQDGAPIPKADAGTDVRYDEHGNSYVAVDAPRAYVLVENAKFGQHELRLSPDGYGLGIYDVAFESCEVPGAR